MVEAADTEAWVGAVMIPIDKLTFCDWNTNEMGDAEMAALIEDIQNGGFDEPAQVVPTEDGNYLVIGGEHRTKAMRALDKHEVPCVVRQDLVGATRQALMLWSVRRNNTRGRVNAQKYAELERELIDQHSMTAEAARRQMLVQGDLLKKLRKTDAITDNEAPERDDDDGADNDSKKETRKESKKREQLLSTLRTAEQDVLLQSPETVEHGYLFFGQDGKLHLVANESKNLYVAVQKMVEACKGNSASVDDFMVSAITKELDSWK